MLRYLLVCAVLLQPGCATILGHNDHRMKVTSTPAGATVYLNGTPVGKTPVDFPVEDLGTPSAIKIRLEGFEDESQRVLRKVQTVAFCNLVNVICWGIDYLSDSMFEIKNDVLHFDLRPYRPGLSPPPTSAPPTPAPSPAPPPPADEAALTAPVEAVAPEALEPPPEEEALVPPPDLSPPPLVTPPG